MRTAAIHRKTRETDVQVELDLDGKGLAEVATGVGFLDHMVDLLAQHALIDLKVSAQGDLHIDQHHTVEDVGLCLGAAIQEALGNKAGIQRYGHMMLPMDDALVATVVDLSGRPHLVWKVEFPTEKTGDFDTELVREFWQAMANSVGGNIHVILHHGINSHHISEAIFKSAARAIRAAVSMDPRQSGIPSTKGTL